MTAESGATVALNTDTILVAPDHKEMLRIDGDGGFYVRGVKLEQDEHEARAVHDAFVAWLASMGFPVRRGPCANYERESFDSARCKCGAPELAHDSSREADARDAARYRWLRGDYLQPRRYCVADYFDIPSGKRHLLDLSVDDVCDAGLRGELPDVTPEEINARAAPPVTGRAPGLSASGIPGLSDHQLARLTDIMGRAAAAEVAAATRGVVAPPPSWDDVNYLNGMINTLQGNDTRLATRDAPATKSCVHCLGLIRDGDAVVTGLARAHADCDAAVPADERLQPPAQGSLPWQQRAYIHLGRVRDGMTPEAVEIVQDFLGPLQPLAHSAHNDDQPDNYTGPEYAV